ncbi:Protein white [Nymphon striatum]|nr:Protein white [Nymphon striatum]
MMIYLKIGSNFQHNDLYIDGEDSVAEQELTQSNEMGFEQPTLMLSWDQIQVWTEEKCPNYKNSPKSTNKSYCKKILDNVSGSVRSGQLLAIIGHSGSGKTTLLNVLNGRNISGLKVDGHISLCTTSYPQRMDNNVHQAFVQQQDLFIETLTVREHLNFHSKIRLSQHLLSASERKKKVDAILLEFGLMKCADTKIGGPNSFKGISGGEMKRLSFATQMMENPDILFCDEPTSGLDSFMALNVVTVLKQMASMGRIVVLTIHQPSSKVFSLFDRILLLAEGRVGFMGSRLQAYKFFNEAGMQCPVNHNPADFYMQQLSTCSDEHHLQYATSKASGIPLHSRICDMFDIKRSTYDGPENHKKLVSIFCYNMKLFSILQKLAIFQIDIQLRCPWHIQFNALMHRSFMTIVREPLLSFVRFIQISVISVVLGSLYFKQTLTQEGVLNINGALYLTLMCVTFQNLFGVITVFCSELPLFLREHSDKLYSNSAYFISKTFAEFQLVKQSHTGNYFQIILPIFIIQPFIIVTVVYFMIDLYQDIYHYVICCLVVILVANVVTSFGYFVSSACSSTQMALTVSTPMIIPLLIFGGYFVKNNTASVYLGWIRYLSWFHHGFQALAINQWRNVDTI